MVLQISQNPWEKDRFSNFFQNLMSNFQDKIVKILKVFVIFVKFSFFIKIPTSTTRFFRF